MQESLLSKKIGQWVLMITFILSIGLFLPFQFINVDILKIFLVGIVSLVAFLIILIQKNKTGYFRYSTNLFIVSTFALLDISILSSIFSNNALISLFGRQITPHSLVGIFALLALSYAVYTFFDDTKEKLKLFSLIFISSVVVLVINLCFVLFPFLPSLNYFTTTVSNTVGSWYDFGFFALFVTLSSVLVLQSFKKNPTYKIMGFVGLVSGLITMLLVNFVFIYIIAILFSCVYLIMNVVLVKNNDETEPSEKNTPFHSYSFIVLAISILFILIGGKTGVLLDSFFNIQYSDVRPSATATLEVAQEAFINESVTTKLFGVGLNRFDTAWLQYKPDEINASQFWDTDFRFGYSFILTNFVNQGVFGLIVWLLFIFVALMYVFKLLIQRNKNTYTLFVHQYSAFGFALFLTILLVYTPSFVVFALFFIFLGLFTSSLKDANLIEYKTIQTNQNPQKSLVYAFTLILVLIAIIYSMYIQVSQYASRIIFDNTIKSFSQTGSIENAINGVTTAHFIFNSDVYNRAMVEIGMMRLNEIIQDDSMSEDQMISQFTETVQAVVSFGTEAIRFDSKSYTNRIILLNVYKELATLEVEGAQEEALSLIDSIEVLTPNNPTLYLERARLYAVSKDYDRAEDFIDQALQIKPNFTAATFLLSQIQATQGETEEAISSIQTALSIDRFDSNLYFQLGLLYYQQERFSEAIPAFESAWITNNAFANALYFLGLSYYFEGRVEDAVALFENLNQEFPENTEVQNILTNIRNGNEPLSGITNQIEELPLEEDEDTVIDTDIEQEDLETQE